MSINFEVTLRATGARRSGFEAGLLPAIDELDELLISQSEATEAARRLRTNGVEVLDIGRFSISASCDEEVFSELFGVGLRTASLAAVEGASTWDASKLAEAYSA